MPDLRETGVTVVEVSSDRGQLDTVRDLWREYWDSLQLSAEFQGFAEELRTLPGSYAAPDGMLLLAGTTQGPAGTAGMRRLNKFSCEAKRLYVRPQYRRCGVAKALLDRLLTGARAAGYSQIYCDTLSTMTAALQLYKRMGFSEVGPYSQSPTPGAVYLRLPL